MTVLFSKMLAPVNGYSVLFEALEEDETIQNHFSFENCGVDHKPNYLARKVRDGRAVWFCAKVTLSNGEKDSSQYLGCCYYDSFEQFIESSDYFADMVEEAYAELEKGE